jgi:prefoldin subunit 5
VIYRFFKNLISLITGFFTFLANAIEIMNSGLDNLNRELEKTNKELERKQLEMERDQLLKKINNSAAQSDSSSKNE